MTEGNDIGEFYPDVDRSFVLPGMFVRVTGLDGQPLQFLVTDRHDNNDGSVTIDVVPAPDSELLDG